MKPSCREAQQLQSEPRAGGERAPRAAGWDAEGEFTCSLDPRSSETSNRTSRSREPKPTERRTAAAAAAPAEDDGKESALLALPLPLPTASSDSVLRSGTNSANPALFLSRSVCVAPYGHWNVGVFNLTTLSNLHIIPEIRKLAASRLSGFRFVLF